MLLIYCLRTVGYSMLGFLKYVHIKSKLSKKEEQGGPQHLEFNACYLLHRL